MAANRNASRATQAGSRAAGRVTRAPRPTATKGEKQPSDKGPSRHYRRARRDRGAETRAQLIEAALEVFGRLGFEGASTRAIAREAGANLAAIVYHFGSKEALHVAVAEYVVGRIGNAIAPALAVAADPAALATAKSARAAYRTLVEAYIEVILGNAEAERWARFIVREQMQPSAAFEAIFRTIGNALGIAGRLVAKAIGKPEGEETKLRAFAMFGQVLIFRVAQALVLRRMGWNEIGAVERARIRSIIGEHIDAILDRGAAS